MLATVAFALVGCAPSVPTGGSPQAGRAAPPTVSVVERNGRTLLTDRSDVVSTALLRGVLGTNAAGCVTVGGSVLVLGPLVRLNEDGSLDLPGGRHYRRGAKVDFGGAFGPTPPRSPCGETGGGYWYG